ncbi:hypothetical protein CVT24_003281 [Panaeolus cyanescens]|uniref:Uncharacterized protein n=1 Tax=Panaeolus cyanescens TaxID=181874 RepID=A0A409YRA7_9AGAR|nr:hypothetical protein CVT24_003281 [Panaeolus cyanescens]
MSSSKSGDLSNAESPSRVRHSPYKKPHSTHTPSHSPSPKKPMLSSNDPAQGKTAFGQNPYLAAGRHSVPVGRSNGSPDKSSDANKSGNIGPIRQPRGQFRGDPYANTKNDGLTAEQLRHKSLKHHLKVKAHNLEVKRVIEQAAAEVKKYTQEQAASASSSSAPPSNTQPSAQT